MVSIPNFSRRRQVSSQSSSLEDRLPFFSFFGPRANSRSKSRSASTSFSGRLSIGSDTNSCSTDSDLDGSAITATTSYASIPTVGLRKDSRSSSSSSVFSIIRERLSGGSPSDILVKKPEKRSFTLSWPSQFSASEQDQAKELNTSFESKLSIRPTEHFRLSSISENSREHPSPNTFIIMDQARLRPGTLLRPGSLLADQREKARRRKDARDMYQTIVRNAERSKSTVPPYEFLELIGKGAFGRVYKCRHERTGDLVAIKIADIDENDFSSSWEEQNIAIRDFQKEVSILQQLKDSKARNVNVIHEAFDLHSQLWIVADYCTGGSIRTLLYPTAPNGLEEAFVIPIARELAVALQDVHSIDIIHRDVKCANVYITENGDIQLGDFGIVGLIEDGQSKRKTVIGTPHFMPIEMIHGMNNNSETDQAYGTEVDVWSYGITVYEMAAGQPPNTRIQPHALAQVLQEEPPRLEGDKYSEELRSFVEFCLQTDPKARPTMSEVLQHPYIANTDEHYPTENLVKLVERFKVWEHGGGSRNSLWSAGGIPAPIFDEDEETTQMSEEDEGWNFSTSEGFDQGFGDRLSQMFSSLDPVNMADGIPAAAISVFQNDAGVLSPAERIRREHAEKAANRGEQYLGKLFAGSEPYGMHVQPIEEPVPPPSDLPLRTYTDQEGEDVSEQVIDLDEANARLSMAAPVLHLDLNENSNQDTIKALPNRGYQDDEEDRESFYEHNRDEKRETMAWTFPSSEPTSEKRETMAWTFPTPDPTSEKRETMAWTFPNSDAEAEKRDTMAWKFPSVEPSSEKRDTMAWSFDTAEPAEPDEPDSFMDLPQPGDDEPLPHGYRPTLKHSATEPIGHFGHLVYNAPRAPVPSRLSTGTIDLDEALPVDLDAAVVPDLVDVERPSTACSLAGSTTTNATSGNPFDLEEDPVLNEVDRNRFSYHKQWKSEGGRLKRSSYKSMQMHARASSLSSTDSEMERTGPKFDEMYENNIPNQFGTGPQYPRSLELGFGDDFSQTDWPNFVNYDRYSTTQLSQPRDLDFPAEPKPRTNGSVASLSDLRESLVGIPDHPTIVIPEPRIPVPMVLAEDVHPQLLAGEFSKHMGNLEGSLIGMIQALRLYARIDDEESEEASPPNGDSGFDSTRDTSEDEDNIYDGSTVRNDRRRRFEARAKSPQLPVSGLH